MLRFQQIRHVLGSEAILTLVLPDNVDAGLIFDSLWSQIEQFEKKFSRFLPQSELSKFNLQAGKKVVISPEFKSLLVKSIEISQKTNGLFNPFILPNLQRVGYLGSWPKPDKIENIIDYRQKCNIVNINQWIIGQNSAKIPKDSAIDLGGIGKGYVLDQLSSYLEKKNINRYWFSLGGDIICNGLDLNDQPWLISIADALLPKNTIEDISNQGQKMAVATSGIVKRQGEYRGKSWHHIIDPETGEPAITDVLTATVCAETATFADVATKCLVIAGSKKLKSMANNLSISKALLQLSPDATIKENQNSKLIKYLKGKTNV